MSTAIDTLNHAVRFMEDHLAGTGIAIVVVYMVIFLVRGLFRDGEKFRNAIAASRRADGKVRIKLLVPHFLRWQKIPAVFIALGCLAALWTGPSCKPPIDYCDGPRDEMCYEEGDNTCASVHVWDDEMVGNTNWIATLFNAFGSVTIVVQLWCVLPLVLFALLCAPFYGMYCLVGFFWRRSGPWRSATRRRIAGAVPFRWS